MDPVPVPEPCVQSTAQQVYELLLRAAEPILRWGTREQDSRPFTYSFES